MSSITLGKYVPYNSFLHRMDARNKIFCLIALMVAIFISYSTWELTFIIGGLLALFTIVLILISHISFKSLFKSLRVLWFMIIFLLIINCLVPPIGATAVAFSIGSFNVYWDAILQSLKIILRLVLMISLSMILTATTKPLELTYALEWYLTPLKIIKFPAHEVAMTISIALRFIPTILGEVERIMKAQSSRGVDFKHGKISSRFKAIISLIIPLFISAFERSEQLADAMEARGYDPKQKRTRYRKLSFHFSDLFAFLLCGGLMAGTIVVATLGYTLLTPSFLPLFIVIWIGILIYCLLLGLFESRAQK